FLRSLRNVRPRRNKLLKNRQSRSDGNMMLNESFDGLLDLRAVHVKLVGGDNRLRGIGADVRLLVRIEFSVHCETVLQIIDSQFGGLAEPYRAKVPGELEPMLVSCVDGGLQLCAGDEIVGLKRAHAF